ncbi:MAG: arginase family protein [Thermomicrobiales bacterium]
MQLHIIALASVEGKPPVSTVTAFEGLTAAASIYLAAGIAERFAAVGAPVATIAKPALDSEEIDDDRIVNLGRLNAKIAGEVVEAYAAGNRPLLLGGTCSHLIGMIAGLQQVHGAGVRLGLLWLDAHGDFNTPNTSLSGMLGGMPVAVTAGLCFPVWREGAGQLVPLPTNRIVMVDVRNLDPAEETLIRATDVEIARFGPSFAIDPVTAAIDRLASEVDVLYVHVDADILDASLQPNHPTAEPNGPDLETVQRVVAHAFSTGIIGAFGVVSVNPTGPDGAISVASGTAVLVAGVERWAMEHTHTV